MKIIFVLFAFVFSCTALYAQPLFTFGNNKVDKEEFLRAYNKNKTAVANKEQALREYLDLYSKFKLKVKAAKDLQLDTLPQIISDMQNFRAQIDEGYMNNEQAVNELVDEAMLHAQKDRHVIHFFIPLDTHTSKTDSAKAVAAMQDLYKNLAAGKSDYNGLVNEVSLKFTAAGIKAADIGYITAFAVPYEYEKIIYSLKVGDAGKPYRSKKGLHIFKVLDERNNPGKWRIAQILFAIPPGSDPSVVQHLADSVYAQLQAGADFAAMAKKFSDDKLTYLSGGEMPEFSTGKFETPYEQQVFALIKDGAISVPFASSFGFHIVKRLSVRPVPADITDAAFRLDIKQKVLLDSRINTAKDAFTKAVLQKVQYKKITAVKNTDLFRYADSVVKNPAAFESQKFPIGNKPIYNFAKSTLTGNDWLVFIRDYKTNPELYKGEGDNALLEKFVTLKSMEYYRKHLEEFNADFRYQIEEFKEGNLLFEIMERKVWSNAANDVPGLKKYYAGHQDKYQWNASAEVLIFSCTSKKAAAAALTALQSGKDWKKIAEESNSTIQSDSGRYELVQLALPANSNIAAGMVTPIAENTDGTAGFVKILQLHAASEPRSFDEAKGLVINDYQNILEEKWLEELKKKYPVKVDEKLFQTLIK